MKVILKRGGNYRERRFEADDKPQDVPGPFGEAMVARGPTFAVKVKTPRPPAAPKPVGSVD